MAHEDDFEKTPCNNCQGCGCTTCGGSGWLIDQTRPIQKHSSDYPPETLFTHYQIELENINEEWDCTICESLEEVLGVLIENGVKEIKIIYFGKETIKYIVPISKYITSNKTFDFQGDFQYFVSISEMSVVTE